MFLLLPGIAVADTAVAVVDTAVAAVVFLVLPSLWIGNRDRDRVRVRDDVDLAATLDFSAAPCLLLIRFDSIRFTLRRYY